MPEERPFTRLYVFCTKHLYWSHCVLRPKFLKRQNRQKSTADGDCKILTKSIPMVSIVRRSLPQQAVLTRCQFLGTFYTAWCDSIRCFFSNSSSCSFLTLWNLEPCCDIFYVDGEKVPLKLLRHFRYILIVLYYSEKFTKKLMAFCHAINPISSECELIR
jgi:hypothetical protein